MLVEFLDIISIDKKPFAENLRLNIQPESHQLRLKVTYINGDEKTPIDMVIFKWLPRIEKLNMSIMIDGKELISKTEFVVKMSFDIFKRQIKISGTVAGQDIKVTIRDFKELLEIPKQLSFLSSK